jgi:hypothetical protein
LLDFEKRNKPAIKVANDDPWQFKQDSKQIQRSERNNKDIAARSQTFVSQKRYEQRAVCNCTCKE